jgi:hypothetical protein
MSNKTKYFYFKQKEKIYDNDLSPLTIKRITKLLCLLYTQHTKN